MPRIGGTVSGLNDAVPKARTVTTTPPLTGGGDLSADRTLAVTVGTSTGTVAAGQHTHPASDLTATGTRSTSTYLRGDNTWSTPPGSAAFTVVGPKTGAYTLAVSDFVLADTSAGAFTVTLPANPPAGTRVGWKLVTAGNTLTIAAASGDVFSKVGGGTTRTAFLEGQGAIAQFDATNRVWVVQANDLPLERLDARYAAAGAVGGGGSVPDASNSTKGLVQLAGDLGGTATSPTVPAMERATNKSTASAAVANGYIGADPSGNVPAVRLPAATTTTSGIVVLAGDLAGTAASPTVVKRGPGGSVPIYQPTFTNGVTPAPNLGSHMRVSNCNIAFTVFAPSGTPVDGQRYLCELQCTGTSTAARTVTLDSTYEIGANVTSRTITVATANAWLYIGMINRNGTWRVLAVDTGA